MVMVQDPASAKYDGMPRNAAETGLADYVLPPDKMPEQLVAYVRHTAVPTRRPEERVMPKTTAALRKVFILLRDQTGHDFSYYKKNTIVRRIERRMAVHQLSRIDQYVRHLQHNPIEVETLFKELLIEVTSFFRDADAFAALKERVVTPLVERTRPDQTLRIWVPGCSTGEEAYSIAMLFREHMDEARHDVRVQIFATDIDTDAIDTARDATYPAGITTDVSPERLQRFFDKADATYRVKRAVRDMLVFAPQNLIRDPPFSKLDLISCRNLLIYMGGELQARVLPLFHYALKEHGYLFLGTSETIANRTDMFATVDRKWKLFQRTGELTRQPLRLELPVFPVAADTLEEQTALATKGGQPATLHDITQRTLLDLYCPSCVVIDEKCDVRYIHGRTGRYLEPATGEPSANLLAMAREGLRLLLTNAVRKCLVTREAVRHERVRVKSDGETEIVNLTVAPLPGPPAQRGLIMVVFEDVGPEPHREPDGAADDLPTNGQRRVIELEHELSSTREYLQTTIEELETSNEELKSANEELQSSNEELQSANEELETSKEELQSVNEELVTVNSELETKLDELSKANNDLNNLLGATRIGTVFLDKTLRVQRFTPDAANLIHLIPADIGRPLSHIVTKFHYDRLTDDVSAVLDTLIPREVEVHAHDGAWYAMRVMPYRTTENVIDGVVITFADISEQKRVQGDLRKLTGALEQCRSDVLITDADGTVEYVNHSFTETSGYPLKELCGKRLGQLEPGGRTGAFFAQLAESIRAGKPWQGEFRSDTGGVELDCEWASISPVRDEAGKIIHFIAVKEPRGRRQGMRTALLLRVGKALGGLQAWHRSAGEGAAEAALLAGLCRLLVEEAGYRQAWIGAPQRNKGRTVRPLSVAGFPEGDRPKATWSDTTRGSNATGTAIRTGQPATLRFILSDPAHGAWHDEATRLGYEATCALPLAVGDETHTVLTVHAAEPDAFEEPEVALLQQLADHVAEALHAARVATCDTRRATANRK